MGKQFITRLATFDSGHRVMNEKFKCFNVHGHTYITEVTFSFTQSEAIGYAIDFKEIKRVFLQYIDDVFDHGIILNPHDKLLIETTMALGSKLYLMTLNGPGEYCNPSVENIAKEVFLSMEFMCNLLYPDSETGLTMHKIKMNETPNCFTEVFAVSISQAERTNFIKAKNHDLSEYAFWKGKLNYDDREK